MTNQQLPTAIADDHVAMRIANVVAQRRQSRQARLFGSGATGLTGMATAIIPFLPFSAGALTVAGTVTITAFVASLVGTIASAGDKEFEDPLREAVSDAVPASWTNGSLQRLANFIEEIEIVGRRGLEEYDRPRMQGLADEYGDALVHALPEDPWDSLDGALHATSLGFDSNPAKMQRNLQRDTNDIMRSIESGMDWQTSRKKIQSEIVASYPATLRMAERFGMDMSRAKRPAPLRLPGEAGQAALPPPVPEELLDLMNRYRAIDPATMRDEDRIAGTALLRNDIPMMTDAWRRARLASPDDDQGAIDAHYKTSMVRMATTLTEILDHVAKDARQGLETTERYIKSKHGSQDPFKQEDDGA